MSFQTITIFIEFTYIQLSNLKSAEHRKSTFSFTVFTLPPNLQPLPLCCPGQPHHLHPPPPTHTPPAMPATPT